MAEATINLTVEVQVECSNADAKRIEEGEDPSERSTIRTILHATARGVCMATSRKPTEPTTRAGILAYGLVQIVAAPVKPTRAMQLGLFGGESPVRKHVPSVDYTRPPRKLTLADLPGGKPPRWYSVGHAWVTCDMWGKDWSHPPTPVPDMTPAQVKSALAAQARRLKGQDDSLHGVEIICEEASNG